MVLALGSAALRAYIMVTRVCATNVQVSPVNAGAPRRGCHWWREPCLPAGATACRHAVGPALHPQRAPIVWRSGCGVDAGRRRAAAPGTARVLRRASRWVGGTAVTARSVLGRARRAGARRTRGQRARARLYRARVSGRRTGVALLYHRIEPRLGDPAREFSPPLSCAAFTAQLEYLACHYHVVSAAEPLGAVRVVGPGRRFPVALTFDDDSPTHLRWAVPELQRVGLPATFFLNGASLEKPRTYWWDRLQMGLDRGMSWEQLVPRDLLAAAAAAGVAEPTVATMAEAVLRLAPAARLALHRDLGPLVGPDPDDAGIREDEVLALVAAGFAIGFHTRDHEPLSLVDDATLLEQLRDGRDGLERLCGHELEAVAYPHGKADPRVARAAREAGFRLGFTVEPAAAKPSTDALLVGRLDATVVPVIDDFSVALAGLLA